MLTRANAARQHGAETLMFRGEVHPSASSTLNTDVAGEIPTSYSSARLTASVSARTTNLSSSSTCTLYRLNSTFNIVNTSDATVSTNSTNLYRLNSGVSIGNNVRGHRSHISPIPYLFDINLPPFRQQIHRDASIGGGGGSRAFEHNQSRRGLSFDRRGEGLAREVCRERRARNSSSIVRDENDFGNIRLPQQKQQQFQVQPQQQRPHCVENSRRHNGAECIRQLRQVTPRASQLVNLERKNKNYDIIVKKVPTFDDNDVESYVENARHYVSQFDDVAEDKLVELLRTGLTGDARMVLRGHTKIISVEKLLKILREVYKPKEKSLASFEALSTLKQKSEEAATVFAYRVREKLIESKMKEGRVFNTYLLGYFIQGLRKELKRKVQERDPHRIKKALNLATKFEKELKAGKPESSLAAVDNLKQGGRAVVSLEDQLNMLQQSHQSLVQEKESMWKSLAALQANNVILNSENFQ